MTEERKSTLVIIGGGEDKQADKKILKEIVLLSGEDRARIGVIATASKYNDELGQEYEDLFYDLGVKEVNTIPVMDRKQSNNRHRLDKILDYDCLFFTGGDQLRISSIIGGTYFHRILHKFWEEKKVIAGTSAGASMMSEVMIVEGDDEEAPRKCTIGLAPGMGLIENVIIDQHFNQRGRIGRLLTGVAQNPHILGIGIDEDTAIVVEDNLSFYVVGKGVATIIDGRNIEYTNITEQHPDESLALTNVTLHILPENFGYDLIDKRAIIKKK
ncbi:cyanophycinase [Irregularibacter muris]|uniref:Cyanophycinase n=1 Tax=Irregularibacter muris TaxID=1796619 RepID=A0AAE3HGP0_9FIRM|nr:cyanophycinase [Irregularibacter muris]MCR1898268.1 cyanophycinase [Irregularibacter muris]